MRGASSTAMGLSTFCASPPVLNEVFTIANFSSMSGTFNGLANGDSVFVSGHEFQVNYDSTNIFLTVMAVPEPGIYLLLLGAAVFFLGRRSPWRISGRSPNRHR